MLALRNFPIAKMHTPNTYIQCFIVNATCESTVRQNKNTMPSKVEGKRDFRDGQIWARPHMTDLLAVSSYNSPGE